MYRLCTFTSTNKRSIVKCELKRSSSKLTRTSSDQPIVDSCEVLTVI